MEAPATDTTAMMPRIQLPLESLRDVVYFIKSVFYQQLTGLQGALSTTADKDNRRTAEIAVRAAYSAEDELTYLSHEMRIDLPIGLVDPRHMHSASGMPHEQVLHVGTYIDQKRTGIVLDEFPGLLRRNTLDLFITHAALSLSLPELQYS